MGDVSIRDIMDNYAKANERAFAHDRSQTVGASEVGQCSRKVHLTKMEGDPKYGYPRNPDYVDTWGARTRGSVYENEFWYPAMKAHYGDKLFFAGPDQKTFVSNFLSATPDGMVYDAETGACFMTECKTVDPRTNLVEAKAENIYQTHVQMGIVREKTQYKPTHSILSYTDASFWNEVKQFRIEYDEKIYQTAKARAQQIMTTQHAGELKPEGWIAGGRECDRCPFSRACGIARVELPGASNAVVDPQFAAEITDMAREIKILEGYQERGAIELRDKKESLKERLREKGVRKIPGVVSWASVRGREAYDNKLIQAAAVAAGVDIEKLKTIGQPSDRLTISVLSETEATQA